MSLILAQTSTAIIPTMNAFFQASGGTPGYVYSVRQGGAGGSINSTTGEYFGRGDMGSTPQTLYDTIQVKDALGAIATAQILVGTPLFLFCEIIQKELGLANGRVYLWDQKVFQPSDNDLYVAVSVPSCKPFANNIEAYPSDWTAVTQTVNMLATLDIDIMSRGPAARDRKEEVILALNSFYAQSQQEINSFNIGKLPPGARFVNLSMIDGAAIPYRFRISINMQYAFSKSKPIDYFDTFQNVPIATNS